MNTHTFIHTLVLKKLTCIFFWQGFQGKTGPPGPPGVVGPQVNGAKDAEVQMFKILEYSASSKIPINWVSKFNEKPEIR